MTRWLLRFAYMIGTAAGSLHPAYGETLADAVRAALAKNPSLAAADAQIRAADQGRNRAEGAYGPTLSLSVSHEYSRGTSIDPPFRQTRSGFATGGSLSLSQPLFTSGRLASGVASARIAQALARESQRVARQALLLDVITAYASVQRDLALYAVARQNKALLEQQQDIVLSRYKLHDATAPDLDQVAGQLAIATGRVVDSRAIVEQSAARFRNLVGHYPGNLAPMPELPPLAAKDLLYEEGVNHSPDFALAKLDELATRADLARARAERGPIINAHAAAQREPLSPYENGPRFNALVAGVTLTMPLYSSGQTISAIREAEQRNQAAQYQLEQASRDMREKIATNWNIAHAAQERLPIYHDAVEKAQRAVNGIQQQQRAGIRTLREVLDATSDLLSARILAAQTEADAAIGRATVLRTAGLLDESAVLPGSYLPTEDIVDTTSPTDNIPADPNEMPVTYPIAGLPLRPLLAPLDKAVVFTRVKSAPVEHEQDETYIWPPDAGAGSSGASLEHPEPELSPGAHHN